MRRNHSIAAVLIMAALAGCAVQRSDRDTRLLQMAVDEADLITNHHDRLMRQLNIADWQMHTGRKEDGHKTLAKAILTLQDPDAGELDEFGRISGWASIAELAREDDPATALKAVDKAVETLQAINPASRRCDYVLSLSHQVQDLRGKKEAVALLAKAGLWAGEIASPDMRRRALMAFANRLFDLEEWDAGQKVLRHDADAAWRSDTLAAMANIGRGDESKTSFGRSVDYKSVYLNQELQMNLRQQGNNNNGLGGK